MTTRDLDYFNNASTGAFKDNTARSITAEKMRDLAESAFKNRGFLVRGLTTGQSITPLEFVTITQWDAVDSDSDSGFSDGVYTVPVSGRWLISASAHIGLVLTTGKIAQVVIYRSTNGGGSYNAMVNGPTSGGTLEAFAAPGVSAISGIFELNADDLILLSAYHNDTSAVTVIAENTLTWFSAQYLGESL